jgi:hypothetical protein
MPTLNLNDILYGDGQDLRPILGLEGLIPGALEAERDERGVWVVTFEEDPDAVL